VHEVKLKNLSNRKDSKAAFYLQELSSKDYIESITMLPDLHWKDNMLVPSSIAIKTREVFVPQFTSVGINCGMTLIDTGISKEQITAHDLQNIFREMNRYAYSSAPYKKPYDEKLEELVEAFKTGAAGLTKKYCISHEMLEGIENEGYIHVELDDEQIAKNIPAAILKTGLGQREMGFDFSGNHFLEFQVIDEVFDEELARVLKLNRDNLYCFLHTGPDSLVGNLLRFYSYDSDMSFCSRTIICLLKLAFYRGNIMKNWSTVLKEA